MSRSVDQVPESGLSRGSVQLLAVLAGLSVANIYYGQPLLPDIAASLGVSGSQVSQLVTVSTAGYAVGLVLVVPFGDLRQPRTILAALMTAVAMLQVLCALAPDFAVLVAATFVMSMCAVGAPLLVAFGATLADPASRAGTTGRIMSGVLLGLLLARTGGGLVATAAGSWRWTYAAAALLALVVAVASLRLLPGVRRAAPTVRPPRLAAITGTLVVLRSSAVLRSRCAIGFFSFAGFSALWAALPLRLAEAPYGYGAAVIGVFGLVGAAGAIGARIVGPVIDRGRERITSLLLLTALVASWVLFGVGGGHLTAIVLGVVVLDLAVQGAQVANLGVILTADAGERSRVTTAYTTTYFVGGAAGAAAAGGAYALIGWNGVCVVGGALALVALALRAAEPLTARTRPTMSSAAAGRSR